MMVLPDPQSYDFPEWVLIGDFFYYARDVVSFGDELSAENLIDAYKKGIFPWFMEGIPLPWYCPEKRAILEFSDLHVSRSLKRASRVELLTFTIDKAFRRVMEECSKAKRPGQNGTWITDEFIEVYSQLHNEGTAHSVEAWKGDDLVGGVYGIDAGGVFCGESMFFRMPNASKLALLFLIDRLRDRGSTWLDIQVMTPHMQALGAKQIDRRKFLHKLREAQARSIPIF